MVDPIFIKNNNNNTKPLQHDLHRSGWPRPTVSVDKEREVAKEYSQAASSL